MKSITQITIILIAVFMILAGCSVPDNNNKQALTEQDTLMTAGLLLDSINMLDSADLIKINTGRCINNCLPFKTFSKLIQYETRLQKLGYYVEWNNETRHYSINK